MITQHARNFRLQITNYILQLLNMPESVDYRLQITFIAVIGDFDYRLKNCNLITSNLITSNQPNLGNQWKF